MPKTIPPIQPQRPESFPGKHALHRVPDQTIARLEEKAAALAAHQALGLKAFQSMRSVGCQRGAEQDPKHKDLVRNDVEVVPASAHQGARFVQPAFAILFLLLALPALAQIPPTIIQQPDSISRSLGDRHPFRVSVRGDSPLSYQWKLAGKDLLNATNATFALTNLTLADAGSYTVVVSNPAGSVTSDPAALDVDSTFTKITTGPVVSDFGYWPSWADYDGDGWIDLLIANASRLNLYHNDGNGTFSRVPTSNAIVGASFQSNNVNGGIWADYDNDGDLDLFVPTGGGGGEENDLLFRNDGQGKFTRITTERIVNTTAASFSATWGDYDRDGWVDLFVGNFGNGSPQTDRLPFLWHNLGGGKFERIMTDPFDTALARHFDSAFVDVNGDGWPDISEGVNPGGKLAVFENQEGKSFERFLTSGTSGGYIGGPAWADFDNDGDLDVLVYYYWSSSLILMKNDGVGNLERVDDGELTSTPARSGGAAWGDYDNDGWLDLFLPRISLYSQDGDHLNQLWHNNGDGTFTRFERGSPASDKDQSWGAAWGDYNNDGFLDLVVGQSGKNVFYHNNGNSQAWLMFRLVGTKSNRAAIGAKVRLHATIKGQTVSQLRELNGGVAAAQQSDLRAHFGLGDATQADEVRIEWPSGQVTELKNVPVKQLLTITEPGGPPRLAASVDNGSTRLTLTGDIGKSYTIESSSDLRVWTLLTILTGAVDPVLFTDPAAGNSPTRYYRAVAP